MAGETALSAYATTGLYILEDNNGWVAANTPNTCNLGGDTGLVLATSFMYFDLFENLIHHANSTRRDDNYTGWKFYQDGTNKLKSKASNGYGMMRDFTIKISVDQTKQQNFEKFFDFHQSATGTGAHQLYLVRQLAASTFKQFSYNATLYKYTPVVLVDYTIVESGSPGVGYQTLQVIMQQADRLVTS